MTRGPIAHRGPIGLRDAFVALSAAERAVEFRPGYM